MLVGEGFNLADGSDLLDKIGLKQDDLTKIMQAGQTIKTTYDSLKKPASPTLAPTSYTNPQSSGGVPTWAILAGAGVVVLIVGFLVWNK